MVEPAPTPVRSRIIALEAVVVATLAVAIAAVVLSLWDAHWQEPFSYDGDAMYYAMVVKTIGRYGTYLHNAHLGWPFGQNLADYPEGADNLNWLLLAIGQWTTGSAWAAMNVFYIASFAAAAATAHVVMRILRVRRALAGAVALLFAFLPYHFFRNETHLQLSMYTMVPFAVLIALLFLSDEPPLTKTDASGRWHFAWRSRRTWLVLAAGALLASGGAYYFVFAMLLFLVAAVVGALAGGRWRPLVACGVLVGCSTAVLALNEAPSIIQRVRYGTAPGVAIRTPGETELYGLRISQLYAPRLGHRIQALADLATHSQATAVPSEGGQQLGVIGAGGLSIILIVFAVSAFRRRRTDWWAGATAQQLTGLGLLALTGMVVGAVSSFSLLLSAAGLSNIRAWNRISIVIGFCALAAIAIVTDRFVERVAHGRPLRSGIAAGAIALVLLGVGLFDQTSASDRPDYAAIHARFTSDKAFFQAVADRLPPGTPVFQLPHMPFPEVPAHYGTGAYDQARGFVFQPQLAWSFGFVRGRHPDYPLLFSEEPTDEWLPTVAAIGFRGLVIDRHGYADDAAALEASMAKVIGQPPLVSHDGRYSFFDLSSFGRAEEGRNGDEMMAALAHHALHDGPLNLRTPDDQGA